MDHREHFYSQYTASQTRTTDPEVIRQATREQARHLKKITARHLPADRSARILDLGCGYGGFLLMLQANGHTNVAGVDISPSQVELARTLGVRDVRVGTLQEALQAESSVACITLFDVIEHLTRSEAIAVLQQIHAALAPGGTLIMRTPNVDALLGSVLSFGDLTHEQHLNVFSVRELFASLPYASCEVLPIRPDGGSPAVRAARAIGTPFIEFLYRMICVANGVSRGDVVSTVNMLIVARK